MKYYYIHGLNSTGHFTADQLTRVLGEKVEILDWKENVYYLNNIRHLINQLKDKEDFILIGSSLGGFYTMEIANTLMVPCVLFNPVIYPRKSFENIKDLEFYKNISEDILQSYPEKPSAQMLLPRVVVVGKNDKIVNPEDTIEFWKNKCNLILTKEEHQMDNFEPFVNDIKHLSIPLFYDIHECI